jgi:hypothetical protein
MPKRNQHVIPQGDGWAVKGADAQKATRLVSTQKQAIDLARAIARNQKSELIIHSSNGQINRRDSYGNDPFPPKG